VNPRGIHSGYCAPLLLGWQASRLPLRISHGPFGRDDRSPGGASDGRTWIRTKTCSARLRLAFPLLTDHRSAMRIKGNALMGGQGFVCSPKSLRWTCTSLKHYAERLWVNYPELL